MAFVDERLDFPLLLSSAWVSLAVKICYVVTPVTFLGGVLELNFYGIDSGICCIEL